MKKMIAVALCAAGFASPAFAQDEGQDNAKAGFRVEARAVYETPTVSSIETSPPVDDPSVGTTAIQPADGTAMKFSTPPPEFRTLKF